LRIVFRNSSANEGLGIFIIAKVFFATFFFKKKVDPSFLMQSLLFLLLASRHMAGQAPERDKEKGLGY
jgi:hypothetical protein